MEKIEERDIQKFEGRSTPPVPEVIQADPFLMMIERLASRPDIDPDKIKQFMDMQERILDRNAKQAFNAAMMRAQNKIELVVAKEDNEQTKSKYADLKAVLIKAKPVYTKEGFSLMFYEGETTKENHKRVCVDIMHEQGHTEKRYGDFAIQTTGIAGKAMMTQIHGEGSAFMYGRRYLTCMIFNIPTGVDDDGNAAGGSTVEYITLDQQTEINDAIADLYADGGKKFLEFLEVESVETIPLKKYKEALAALKTVRMSRPKK